MDPKLSLFGIDIRKSSVWCVVVHSCTTHCAVSFTTVVEQFISKAKRPPISEFYGSNFPFFSELKFSFPWGNGQDVAIASIWAF